MRLIVLLSDAMIADVSSGARVGPDRLVRRLPHHLPDPRIAAHQAEVLPEGEGAWWLAQFRYTCEVHVNGRSWLIEPS